uniref:Uncharacterized protein n=1 Tax=Arundo donax TaxID=35708 RepID=A0A0A8ZZ59_ARUDO
MQCYKSCQSQIYQITAYRIDYIS